MKAESYSLIFFSLLSIPVAKGEIRKASKTFVKLEEKSSYQKFSERLKISYFGFLTTPPVKDLVKGKMGNAAISPSLGVDAGDGHSNHDTWPTNIWNQISFNYNYGAKLNFIVNPRFLTPLTTPTDMKRPEDRSFIAVEDVFTGFQGTIHSSLDKKFNFFTRFGVRIPTSRLSRNSMNAGFGKISRQLEFAYNPSYDINKKWQIALLGTVRQWVYEERFNFSRLRVYTAPYVQYTYDDTTRFMLYYENMIENNKRWKSINNKDPVYKDILQDILIGVSKDVTPKLTLFPFIGMYIDDEPISTESAWIGAWISYKIK